MNNLDINILKEMCMTPSPSNNEEQFFNLCCGVKV